ELRAHRRHLRPDHGPRRRRHPPALTGTGVAGSEGPGPGSDRPGRAPGSCPNANARDRFGHGRSLIPAAPRAPSGRRYRSTPHSSSAAASLPRLVRTRSEFVVGHIRRIDLTRKPAYLADRSRETSTATTPLSPVERLRRPAPSARRRDARVDESAMNPLTPR